MLKLSSTIRTLGTSLLVIAAASTACSPATDPESEGGDGDGATGSGGAGSGTGGAGSGGLGSGGLGSGGLSTGGAGSGGLGSGGLGTGGADAGTGGESMGTGGATTLPPSAIIFEEDFEGASEDSVPAGWNSFVSYVVDMGNMKPEPPFALADSSKAHGGSMALHVSATSAPAMLTRPLPQGTDKIYVRAFVWLTNKLGQNPGNNHETLIGVRGTPGGANDEVRFGEIKGVIGTNEVPTDDISPKQDQWGMGPIIPAGEWNCIEVAFLADGANHEVRAWNNGTEVHAVNAPDQWNNGVLGSDFLTGKFNEFIIGWHSFSNYANEIWFDDIVVATMPIGCGTD